jgi:hypothetical protein
MKSLLSFVLITSFASLAGAQSRLPAEMATPLSGDALRIATAVPDEHTADPGEHYPVSNEWRHDLWFESVRDLGGAFVGVGTDQCYTLAAAQNAQMIWIVDFDPLVPVVHRMYDVLVRNSPTAAELVARFDEANEDATLALLASEGADEGVVRAYRRNRGRFFGYLGRASHITRDGVAGTWLSDPTFYARIRALFLGGRVVARNGDVTGASALRGVGAAATELGVPVRVLYFSNAEQFFRYTDEFNTNVRSLPTDERTVVLRTFRNRRATYPRFDTWHYLTEPMSDFLERLALGYRRSTEIVADVLSRLDADGATAITSDTPRRAAAARAARRADSPREGRRTARVE